MKDSLSPLFILLAAILWGTTGTAQAFAPANTHPIAFGAMRLVFGGSTLLLFVLIKGKLQLKNWPMKKVLFAAMCMAFYQPLFFSAVKITGIAIGTVVGIGSSPILAGMIEWFINRKKPVTAWWIATGIAILGALLLFVDGSAISVKPLGIIMALGAGLSFAIYTISSKELVKTQPPEAVAAVVFSLSAVLLSPLLLIYDLIWITEINGIGTSLYIGVVATAVAYHLFVKGLAKVPASTAVTLSLGEPLTAAMLGAFLVGEALTITSWIGVSFIFAAILMISYEPKKHTDSAVNLNEKAVE